MVQTRNYRRNTLHTANWK